jgi:hypothetical protein
MSLVGLRTGSQCPHPKNKFTPEEDSHLVELVEQFGIDSWPQLSRHMPGRNSRQCRDRWMNYLSPDICKGPWTDAEEALLCQKIAQFGHSWKRIASCFNGRSEVNVKSHWNQIQRKVQRDIIKAVRYHPNKREIPIPQVCAGVQPDFPRFSYAEDDFYFCGGDLWDTF